MPNQIKGLSNQVKKQLNDLWLSISFEPHKDLYTISVDQTAGGKDDIASGSQLSVKEVSGSRIFEDGSNGHSGLETTGEMVLLVVRNPIGENDITVTIPFKAPASATFDKTATITINKHSGKNQATFLVDGVATGATKSVNKGDLIKAIDKSGITVKGAKSGDNFKLVSMPSEPSWNYQGFVRAITPNIPKDFEEVADHFDGMADVIRRTTVRGLTLSKVFEDIPGSFMVMNGRHVTVKAEVRENDRSVPSEVHFYTYVRGTGKVTFNRDAESITELEASMLDWITVSG